MHSSSRAVRAAHAARRRWLAGAGVAAALVALLVAAEASLPGRAAPRTLAALLPPAPRGRARAALLVDSRDCLAHLALLDLLQRPRIAAAIAPPVIVARDGERGRRRAADALLTHAMDVPVLAAPPALTPALLAYGDAAVPRLVLLADDGRTLFATRAPTTTRERLTLAAALERVADHYLATRLATVEGTP